jgi:hypothetical protein
LSLATWADRLLVNTRKHWGGYTWVQSDSGYRLEPRTRPPVHRRGQSLLTLDHLVAHFGYGRTPDIVGLHAVSAEDASRFGVLELDSHGPAGSSPEANRVASVGWYAALCVLGFKPLLWCGDQGGSLHLEIICREPVASARMFHFMRSLSAEHAKYGLATYRPETFPKQPSVANITCGNWVRLIGRHPKKGCWPLVWDGGRWLEEQDAVAFVLALQGDDPDLIPEAPPPTRVETGSTSFLPFSGTCNLSNRIAGYIRKQPNLGEGQGRDDVAFRIAAFLVRDLAVSDDVAMAWLRIWDANNRPPKGEAALIKVVAGAHRYGRNAVGAGHDLQPLRVR